MYESVPKKGIDPTEFSPLLQRLLTENNELRERVKQQYKLAGEWQKEAMVSKENLSECEAMLSMFVNEEGLALVKKFIKESRGY